MWRFYFIGFTLLLFFDTLGHISFKYTAVYSEPFTIGWDWLWRIFSQHWVYINLASYFGAFCTWMILLKRAPIGPAFAVSHLQVVTVMMASVWLFNDQITLTRLLGSLLIIAGIICLAFAEKAIHIKNKERHSALKK